MKKDNVATLLIGDKKYSIDGDTIVNVTLKSGVIHENLRVVGTTMMRDGLRAVGTDGIIEIPSKIIEDITDANNGDFSGVTVTMKK